MTRSNLKLLEALPEEVYANAVTLPLPIPKLEVTVLLEPIGLQAPKEGDNVGVAAIMLLPCNEHNRALHESIQFCSRLKIMEYELGDYWGNHRQLHDPNQGVRQVTVSIYRPTWEKAFHDAAAYLCQEYNALLAAVLRREESLFSSGVEIALVTAMLENIDGNGSSDGN